MYVKKKMQLMDGGMCSMQVQVHAHNINTMVPNMRFCNYHCSLTNTERPNCFVVRSWKQKTKPESKLDADTSLENRYHHQLY